MKPVCSISLDLDNEWSYLRTRGNADWERSRSYLPFVVPRILKVLEQAGVPITFFIVGRDAAMQENSDALRQIAGAGHEIANHTYMHEPWLHLYSREQLHEELSRTEEAIHDVTGHHTRGFRGPGFSTSPLVREVLHERGYTYDASLFPTVMGPVARAVFFLTSRLPAEEKAKRKGLYGSFRDAFGTLEPFAWPSGLMEVPVTTMPLFRVPIHLTYLLFLASFSMPLARLYWRTAVTMCRLRKVAPSLLLHPTDFLDSREVPSMDFFPGMRLPSVRKLELIRTVLTDLKAHWKPATMADHVRSTTRFPASSLSNLIEKPSHEPI